MCFFCHDPLPSRHWCVIMHEVVNESLRKICHSQQNVPQHYYLLNTLVTYVLVDASSCFYVTFFFVNLCFVCFFKPLLSWRVQSHSLNLTENLYIAYTTFILFIHWPLISDVEIHILGFLHISTLITPKSLGTNLHLWCFCAHARQTVAREYNFTCLASPPPHIQWTLKTSTFSSWVLTFYEVGRVGGTVTHFQKDYSAFLNFRWKKKTQIIVVIAVESAVKYSFVLKGTQTRWKGQYNAELTLSPRLCVKPLITAITALRCITPVSQGLWSTVVGDFEF